jgi:hypothetical protein
MTVLNDGAKHPGYRASRYRTECLYREIDRIFRSDSGNVRLASQEEINFIGAFWLNQNLNP